MPLGVVSRPHGIRGAVVVHCDPSMADVFVRGLVLELADRSGVRAALKTKVLGAGPVRGGVRLTLEGVADRNASEALVGAEVLAERGDLRSLGEGEYLDLDLLGCTVVTRDGRPLGLLTEVIATGANDVWVVKADDGAEVLVPAVRHAVLEVDLQERRVVVDAEALEYGATTEKT